jgi:enterobactin synthetase component D
VRRSELATAHGRAVLVTLDAGEPPPALVGDEVTAAARLGEVRRREWALGRAALRELIGGGVAIGADDRGAPVLPAGAVGSLSHKGEHAAAIVGDAAHGFVGIDLERAEAPRMMIERRILSARELAAIGDRREVTRAFAIKEAIYKAVDPIVRRYVGFTEVELSIEAGGACRVTIVDAARLPVAVEAWWSERDGLWVATARARRRA